MTLSRFDWTTKICYTKQKSVLPGLSWEFGVFANCSAEMGQGLCRKGAAAWETAAPAKAKAAACDSPCDSFGEKLIFRLADTLLTVGGGGGEFSTFSEVTSSVETISPVTSHWVGAVDVAVAAAAAAASVPACLKASWMAAILCAIWKEKLEV